MIEPEPDQPHDAPRASTKTTDRAVVSQLEPTKPSIDLGVDEEVGLPLSPSPESDAVADVKPGCLLDPLDIERATPSATTQATAAPLNITTCFRRVQDHNGLNQSVIFRPSEVLVADVSLMSDVRGGPLCF